MKKQAFTLSEVLITMSIIGIVAALTVPNLVNNYQKEAQAIQIRKAVNEMTNAVDMLITEEGKTKFSQTSVFTGKQPDGSSGSLTNFIKSHFKVAAEYNAFASKYKSISGTSATFACDGNLFLLANGVGLCVKASNNQLHVYVDTNGQDKPNISGRDLFAYYITSQGQIVGDNGSSGSSTNEYGYSTGDESGDTCTNSTKGIGCLNKLMGSNWKMNY